ncbi:phenylpyruvate tautomerase MIF-related protein [Candidatus Riflebacteria bacterium]
MPLIKLQTQVPIADENREKLQKALSKIICSCIGKPEQYVMVCLDSSALMFAGIGGNAAFAEVRSIGGLSPAVNKKISSEICQYLDEFLEIPPERVFINFLELSAQNWGWKGSTFG